jgi:phosphoribosyl 1,2-cyclic phosphodiesterase
MEPAGASRLRLRFWGVRGSIACPGASWARYGGNTSCIEVWADGHLIVLDAGTGIRPLGDALMPNGPFDAHILMTHTHMDHIVGLPFFRPLFDPRNRFRVWAGHLADGRGIEAALQDFMAAPLFPVAPGVFRANVSFRDFRAGETLEPYPSVRVRTAPLRHPNGGTGYRIEVGERSICYVTDTVHIPGEPDKNVLDLIEGADLVIYDSSFTDDEFEAVAHYGHSTWQEGVRLCEAAGVERLVIFHHDPSHDDAFMDDVAAQAEAMRPGTVVAKEGMEIDL